MNKIVSALNREEDFIMDPRVHAYLNRIGYDGSLDLTAQTLSDIQERHLLTVPYENIDILEGKRLSLEIDDLYGKIVTRRRGGYCFEVNALFGWLTEELGFPTEHFFGRFVRGEPEIPMRRHHVLVCEAEGNRYVCDVGVGIAIARRPLLLRPDIPQPQAFGTYKLTRDPQLGWVIHSLEKLGWEWLYAFTEEPQLPVDFVQPTFFCEYAPESIFNKSPMIALRTEHGRKTLDGMTYKVFTPDGVEVRELEGRSQLRSVLLEEFGIEAECGFAGG